MDDFSKGFLEDYDQTAKVWSSLNDGAEPYAVEISKELAKSIDESEYAKLNAIVVTGHSRNGGIWYKLLSKEQYENRKE
jgi:hypothetical protein